MENTIKFEMTLEEATAVLKMVAQLPTQSNAWPFYQKILEQYQAQAPKPETEESTIVTP